jgi:Ca2+-binding EF-hand superfamily protein
MIIYSKITLIITLLVAVSGQAQANDNRSGKERPHARPSFESIDSNADGDIDFDEFSSHKIPHGDHQTVFSHIDIDNNGIISSEEFNSHKPPHRKNGKL